MDAESEAGGSEARDQEARPSQVDRPIGRRRALTPEKADVIVAALRGGNFVSTSMRLAGLSPSLFGKYRREVEDGTAPPDVRAFIHRAAEAMAEAEEALIATVRAAGDAGDWRASAWMLSRRAPERWGDRKDVHVTSTSTKRVIVEGLAEAEARVVRGSREASERQEDRRRLPHGSDGGEGSQVPAIRFDATPDDDATSCASGESEGVS